MTYEDDEIVEDDRFQTTEMSRQPPVRQVRQPAPRVIEEEVHRPAYTRQRDPVGNALAASQLIQTIVWAVVILVLLVVGILILVHYNILTTGTGAYTLHGLVGVVRR